MGSDFVSSSDIVIKNQFTNQKSAGSSRVSHFVMNYMLRADAVEPLVLNEQRQRQYLQDLSQLKWPDTTNALAYVNRQIKYDGVGFDLDSVALSRREQESLAHQAQAAYDRGGTVRQMVISFDTGFLQRHQILNPNLTVPIKRGDLRGQVDSRRLRLAVTDGIKSMLNHTTMHNPKMVAAIQTDTSKVHVHLCLWDNDPKVKDDRGMINSTQKLAFNSGFNYALDRLPAFINESHSLENVAESMQQNADFKVHVLEKELYNSALRLDRQSLNEYVYNLALFDQRTLSVKQRDNLKNKIVRDFVKQGRRVNRSHTLSNGQRRARRQIRAQLRATNLRQRLREFDAAAVNNQVVSSAWVVKDAMNYEYIRQQRIVEKYRMFQRPRVDAIYQVRRQNLEDRRQDLLDRREQLLQDLPHKKLNTKFVKSLLTNQQLMSEIGDNQEMRQDLIKAYQNPDHHLQIDTVYFVSQHVSHSAVQEDECVRQLTVNQQQPKLNVIDDIHRKQLLMYLHDLSEYEMDAASFGGLGTDKMNLDYLNASTIPVPSQTESIYQRQLGRENDVLLASDIHDVLDAGSLKPGVEIQLRRDLQERGSKLLKAHNYFKSTNQQDPRWLTMALKDVNREFSVMNASTGNQIKVKPVKENTTIDREGYNIARKDQQSLVRQHLRDVDGLSR